MAAEASPWKLGGLGVVELGKRVWKEINEDEILDRAASLAYYFVLAMFPMLLFLVSLMGVMASQGEHLRNQLMQYVAQAMPGSASGLVQQTLQEIIQSSGGGKLSFGVLAALWSASAGVVALMNGMNAVYDVKEGRSFIKVRAIAIGLTVALSILTIAALVIVLFGGTIADKVGAMVHLGTAFTLAWKIVQWPAAFFFLILSFAMVYYFAPNVEQPKWTWITPGAAVGVILWILASVAFKIYLGYSNTYSKTYGSLGAAIILLLWLYVSGLSLLVGGEVNAEIEHAAAEHGVGEAKAPGEKVPGGQSGAAGGRRPKEKRPAA